MKTGNLGIVDNGRPKESAPKESHVVPNMTSPRKAKTKANVIDQVLLHWDRDCKAWTLNMETMQQKEESRKAPARLGNRISLRVSDA